jgi:site-specific recombinase XerD
MIEDMTVRNLSPTTQQSYIHAVKKFSQYFGRSPDRLGLEQVHAYQLHLVSRGVAWATLNQVVSALRFFYRVTLSRTDLPELIPYARVPKKLPVILGQQEVARFFEAVDGLRPRVALTTAYAAGLRASEVVALHIEDIDSSRMLIRVQRGKGGKQRYVMLSPTLLGILRAYYKIERPRGANPNDQPDPPPAEAATAEQKWKPTCPRCHSDMVIIDMLPGAPSGHIPPPDTS